MHSAIIAALVGMVQPAAAAPQGAPAPVARPDVVVEGSKMVCRREVVIGSNIPGKRVCKPKNQLASEQLAGRDEARAFVVPSGATSSN